MENEVSKISKKPNYKILFWVLISLITVFLVFYIYDNEQEKKQKAIDEQKRQQYELIHQKIIEDSLIQVRKNQSEYFRQNSIVQKWDSARKVQRFKIGDIVFLKPDSLKGVIYDITVDSSFMSYNFFILIANKGQDPVIFQRSLPLLY